MQKHKLAKILGLTYLGLWGLTATLGAAAAREQVDSTVRVGTVHEWSAVSFAPFLVKADFRIDYGKAFGREFSSSFVWMPGRVFELERETTASLAVGPF